MKIHGIFTTSNRAVAVVVQVVDPIIYDIIEVSQLVLLVLKYALVLLVKLSFHIRIHTLKKFLNVPIISYKILVNCIDKYKIKVVSDFLLKEHTKFHISHHIQRSFSKNEGKF